MKNILFIYGYGGSPSSKFCQLITKSVPESEYRVICPVYPQEDCAATCAWFKNLLDNQNFDLIIGTSLGGFITLALPTSTPKIVLNPCMKPSVELPKLKPREGHPDDVAPTPEMIQTYAPFENMVNRGMLKEGRVIGLFGKEDELLGEQYKDSFRSVYDEARSMPGGHHGNSEAIPSIWKAIQDICAL